MEPNVFDKVHDVDLKKTMEQSYIDYAMSVISARALPDARDGLKPVQRRVLYSMIELNNGPDKPHRKCARIVGDTMGKYHPHGDSSIYGALVNMAQDWSTRYPLVDGHGNFGSVDGDGAAAMRYTEARLSRISMEMLADINKDTVDFIPNFDDTEKEPVVLPSRFPQPSGKRNLGNRRGHGHQYSAPQPAGGDRRGCPHDRQPGKGGQGYLPGGDHGDRKGAGFPHRGHDPGKEGH